MTKEEAIEEAKKAIEEVESLLENSKQEISDDDWFSVASEWDLHVTIEKSVVKAVLYPVYDGVTDILSPSWSYGWSGY